VKVIKFQRVIIITGTPGVGKTAVSKALAEKLEALYVSLADLVEKENLALGVDRERNTAIADLDRLSARVNQIIGSTSLDVVVEGHYASDVISPDLVFYIFVLRIDPDRLEARLRARGSSDRQVLENVTSEVLDVCLIDAIKEYGLERVDEIDATNMSVQDVVFEVMKVLDGVRKCRSGVVDWFSRLEMEGRLDRFLTMLNKI